jgi:hypothetical protein
MIRMVFTFAWCSPAAYLFRIRLRSPLYSILPISQGCLGGLKSWHLPVEAQIEKGSWISAQLPARPARPLVPGFFVAR